MLVLGKSYHYSGKNSSRILQFGIKARRITAWLFSLHVPKQSNLYLEENLSPTTQARTSFSALGHASLASSHSSSPQLLPQSSFHKPVKPSPPPTLSNFREKIGTVMNFNFPDTKSTNLTISIPTFEPSSRLSH